MDWYESTALTLMYQYPRGYKDDNWTIRKHEDEYFVKWTNNKQGIERREWSRYWVNNEFNILSYKTSWLNVA